MNKKNLSIVALVVGCLSALVGVFYLVQTIQTITDFNFDAPAKNNFYVVFLAVLFALAAVGFGFGAFFLIKAYVAKKEEGESVAFPMLVYFLYEAVINFMVMCFWGFNSGKNWTMVILGIAGACLVLVAIFGKMVNKTKSIILICAAVLGFALSIVGLSYAGGVSVATYVFTMLLFIGLATYYIFAFLLVNGNNTNSEKTAE